MVPLWFRGNPQANLSFHITQYRFSKRADIIRTFLVSLNAHKTFYTCNSPGDLNELESESSGLIFLHFLCQCPRSPLLDKMRDEQNGPPFHRILVSVGAPPGKDLLLRISMWLLAAFNSHMLQIQGPHLAGCIVLLIILLLVHLQQLSPFM